MIREEVGKIVVDAVYRFAPPGCEPGGLYRVHSFARHALLGELVVYIGLDGDDVGQYFACQPWDFAVKFRPEKKQTEAAPAPTEPEKVAGYIYKPDDPGV